MYLDNDRMHNSKVSIVELECCCTMYLLTFLKGVFCDLLKLMSYLCTFQAYISSNCQEPVDQIFCLCKEGARIRKKCLPDIVFLNTMPLLKALSSNNGN